VALFSIATDLSHLNHLKKNFLSIGIDDLSLTMSTKLKNGSYLTFAWTVSPRTGTTTLVELKASFIKYVKCNKKKITSYAYALELGKVSDHPHIHVLCKYVKPHRVGNLRISLEKWWSKELAHAITPNFIGKKGCKVAHSPHFYFTQYMQKEGIEFVNNGFDVKSLKKNHTSLSQKMYHLGHSRISIHKNNFLDLYGVILTETDFSVLNPWTGHDINGYINSLAQYLHAHKYQVSYLLDFKKRVWDRILFYHHLDLDFRPDA